MSDGIALRRRVYDFTPDHPAAAIACEPVRGATRSQSISRVTAPKSSSRSIAPITSAM
jgi:hypothetical protein